MLQALLSILGMTNNNNNNNDDDDDDDNDDDDHHHHDEDNDDVDVRHNVKFNHLDQVTKHIRIWLLSRCSW